MKDYYWQVVVGNPKMKYWKSYNLLPNLSNIGIPVETSNGVGDNQFATRKLARELSKRQNKASKSWNYKVIKVYVK